MLHSIDGKAYALVTLVDDPNLFPTGQVNGIYRIDGPNSFTVIADIGAFNIAHPPTGFDFDVSTGVLYAIQTYRGGFLVTDGHLNRVLYVTLDGHITIIRRFLDIVPTGLEVRGNRIYMSQAGPVPHLPENGKVLSFSPLFSLRLQTLPPVLRCSLMWSSAVARHSLLSRRGLVAATPKVLRRCLIPAHCVRVNANGTFTVIADELDRPTSLEIIGNTAYIVTLGGEIWTVDNIADPPFGHSLETPPASS